jgi:putative addiction module component (TIGR02574 family)
MTKAEKVKALLEQALELPEAERTKLAYELLESVEGKAAVGDGLTEEWREEISRRVDLILAGKSGPDEDWRIVLDRIRRASPRS